MMQAERRCTKCAAPLTSVGEAELCPGCLLEAALGQTQAPGSGTDGGVSTRSGHALAAHFGNYELLEEIARGGVGIVYRARQIELGRVVALKLLISGPLATPETVQRFRVEAAVAASLQHPNIVAIHEVGFFDGQHFIAMDYVSGRSLADMVRDGPIDAQRAATWMKTVAEAIHFAHERKILHRDLKPSNVLIDEFGAPRVTDFGLARRLDAETVLTLSGQVFGSPSYMAPEQAAARHGQVGRHTDVYALGALLYHLLTGRPPFTADTVPGTLHEVLHSEAVSPRLLVPGLSRDLETICLKCLEKEPSRRYATAHELADELARFLRSEPTRARPVTTPERIWRWTKRKPALAAMIVLVHLVAAAGLTGIVWQWLRAEQNATEARSQRDLADGRAYAAQMRLAYADFRAGKLGSVRKKLEAWKRDPGRSDRPDWRGFEWRWLHRLCASSPSEVIATNASGFTALAVSPDGRSLALGAVDGMVYLVSAGTGVAETSWTAHAGALDGLAFFPGAGNRLATVGGDDMLLKIWEIEGSRGSRLLVATNCSKGMLAHVAVSGTGRFLATGAPEGSFVNVWELEGDAIHGDIRLALNRRCEGYGPSAFSPDEKILAVANYSDFSLALWDLSNGALREKPKPKPADYAKTVVFSPDGKWVATTAGKGQVVLWPVAGPSGQSVVLEAKAVVLALDFSADNKTVFAATIDENIQAWDLDAAERPAVLRGHSDGVNGLVFLPRESVLVSVSLDGTARRWHADSQALAQAGQTPAEFEVLKSANDTTFAPQGHGNAGFCLSVSPDQRHMAVSFIYEVWFFDLASGSVEAKIKGSRAFGRPDALVFAVEYSPDGRWLVLGGGGGMVVALDTTTLQPVKEPLQVLKGPIGSLAFGLDGRVLLSGTGFSGEVALTDVQNWRCMRIIPAAGNLPREAFAVSADGGRVVTSSPDHYLIIHELESGRRLAKCPQRVRFLGGIVFSPNGESVVFSDESGSIFLWELAGQRRVRRWRGHRGHVLSLAFSRDGRTLASGGLDETIRLWRPDLNQEVATLAGHGSAIFSLSFAAHGDALASVGFHSTEVLVWHAAPQATAERK